MPKTDEDFQLSQIVYPWARALSSPILTTSAITFNDTNARLTKYIRPLERQGGEMLKMYKAGRLGSHDVVAHKFINLRNQLVAVTRGAISSGAFAMSEYIKLKPPTEVELRNKYSLKLGLSPNSSAVSEMIMEKSINTNPSITG